MARNFVRNLRGYRDILNSEGVRRELNRRARQVEQAAESSAPFDSGEYRSSIRVESATTDRAVERVIADAPHAIVVEARTGNLARSLDSAR